MAEDDDSDKSVEEDGVDDAPEKNPSKPPEEGSSSKSEKRMTRSDVKSQEAGTSSAGASAKNERTPSKESKGKGKERRIGTRKSLRIKLKDSGGPSGREIDEMGNKKGSLRIRNQSSSKDPKGTPKKGNAGGGSSSGKAADETGLRIGTRRSSGKDVKGKKDSDAAGSSNAKVKKDSGAGSSKAKGKRKMSDRHASSTTDENGKKKKKDGSLRIGENSEKSEERRSGKDGNVAAKRRSLRMEASNVGGSSGKDESPYKLRKRKRSQTPEKGNAGCSSSGSTLKKPKIEPKSKKDSSNSKKSPGKKGGK